MGRGGPFHPPEFGPSRGVYKAQRRKKKEGGQKNPHVATEARGAKKKRPTDEKPLYTPVRIGKAKSTKFSA